MMIHVPKNVRVLSTLTRQRHLASEKWAFVWYTNQSGKKNHQPRSWGTRWHLFWVKMVFWRIGIQSRAQQETFSNQICHHKNGLPFLSNVASKWPSRWAFKAKSYRWFFHDDSNSVPFPPKESGKKPWITSVVTFTNVPFIYSVNAGSVGYFYVIYRIRLRSGALTSERTKAKMSNESGYF